MTATRLKVVSPDDANAREQVLYDALRAIQEADGFTAMMMAAHRSQKRLARRVWPATQGWIV